MLIKSASELKSFSKGEEDQIEQVYDCVYKDLCIISLLKYSSHFNQPSSSQMSLKDIVISSFWVACVCVLIKHKHSLENVANKIVYCKNIYILSTSEGVGL